MAARRRLRGEVPECPPSPALSTPLLSSPLPRRPQPPVASDPAPGSRVDPECVRRRVGTLADPTLEITRVCPPPISRDSLARDPEARELIRWG